MDGGHLSVVGGVVVLEHTVVTFGDDGSERTAVSFVYSYSGLLNGHLHVFVHKFCVFPANISIIFWHLEKTSYICGVLLN